MLSKELLALRLRCLNTFVLFVAYFDLLLGVLPVYSDQENIAENVM